MRIVLLLNIISIVGTSFLDERRKEQKKKYKEEKSECPIYGDTLAFCVCNIVCILSIMGVIIFYTNNFTTAIISVWGKPENWDSIKYLQEYRSWSYPVCRIGIYSVSSIWSPFFILLGSSFLWFIQRKLRQPYPSILSMVISLIIICGSWILMFSFVHMMMMPLGYVHPLFR